MGNDPLAPLRARFTQRCVDDVATLRSLLNQDPVVRREPLRMLAHRLSGIAGSFGHTSLSTLAGDIELSELVTALELIIREVRGSGPTGS